MTVLRDLTWIYQVKSGKSGYLFCSFGVRAFTAPDERQRVSRDVCGRLGVLQAQRAERVEECRGNVG